jgi:hypothetical protein
MTSLPEPMTGGCACGAVRYEISEPLLRASYCHCTRCQRRTGSAASAQGRVQPGSLRWTQGQDNIGAWTPEGGFSKAFCKSCGGQLYSRDPDDPDNTIAIRLGTFDGDPGIRPEKRIHVASAVAWEPIPDDGLPRFDAGG